ncbi:MAG: hypothetical protein ACREP8_05595, partial [Candidatus Binatia bacterium]
MVKSKTSDKNQIPRLPVEPVRKEQPDQPPQSPGALPELLLNPEPSRQGLPTVGGMHRQVASSHPERPQLLVAVPSHSSPGSMMLLPQKGQYCSGRQSVSQVVPNASGQLPGPEGGGVQPAGQQRSETSPLQVVMSVCGAHSPVPKLQDDWVQTSPSSQEASPWSGPQGGPGKVMVSVTQVMALVSRRQASSKPGTKQSSGQLVAVQSSPRSGSQAPLPHEVKVGGCGASQRMHWVVLP